MAAKEVTACNEPPEEKAEGHDLDFEGDEEEDERAVELQTAYAFQQQQAQYMQQMHQQLQQQTLQMQQYQAFMAAVTETTPERVAELQAFIQNKHEEPAPLPPPLPQQEAAKGSSKHNTAATGKGSKKTVQGKFLKTNSTGTPLPAEAAAARARADELKADNVAEE